MIKIVQGSETAIKEEMKTKTKEIREKMKTLRKKLRDEKIKINPDPYFIQKITDEIDNLEAMLKYYASSRVLPVQVGTIIINYKAVKRFSKALKNLNFEISLNDCLRFDYGVGFIEFHDLSEYYQGFQFVPKGDVLIDSTKA